MQEYCLLLSCKTCKRNGHFLARWCTILRESWMVLQESCTVLEESYMVVQVSCTCTTSLAGILYESCNTFLQESCTVLDMFVQVSCRLVPRPSAASFFAAYVTFEPWSDKLSDRGSKNEAKYISCRAPPVLQGSCMNPLSCKNRRKNSFLAHCCTILQNL